jgi:hypothetical protein
MFGFAVSRKHGVDPLSRADRNYITARRGFVPSFLLENTRENQGAGIGVNARSPGFLI